MRHELIRIRAGVIRPRGGSHGITGHHLYTGLLRIVLRPPLGGGAPPPPQPKTKKTQKKKL